MTLAEEYRLSEYEELSLLHNTEDIYIVRNKMNGTICVRKQVSAELKAIYLFLRQQNNPCLPRIYECVEDGETLIVIEEYLTGKNLKEIMEERCISEEEAVSIAVRLCSALFPLHCANPPVICRDLKAANVMLTGDGAVKIVDFDISRMYQSGQNRDTKMMGTEGYAAPEQFGFRQTGRQNRHLCHGSAVKLHGNRKISGGRNLCRRIRSDCPPLRGNESRRQISDSVGTGAGTPENTYWKQDPAHCGQSEGKRTFGERLEKLSATRVSGGKRMENASVSPALSHDGSSLS